MPFSLVFIEHDGWTTVVTTGRLDSQEALLSHSRAILQNLLSSGVHRVLVDNREVSMSVDAFDVFQVVKQLVEDGAPALGISFAGLFTEPMALEYRFFETAFRNNSLRGRIFFDELKALEWLTS